jgi:hypothetical protein
VAEEQLVAQIGDEALQEVQHWVVADFVEEAVV